MSVSVCASVCVCVCALRRDHFNCFLIPAESTLNTYCLINNNCIKVCFYLCTLTMKTKQILYIQVHLNKLECRGKVHLFQ